MYLCMYVYIIIIEEVEKDINEQKASLFQPSSTKPKEWATEQFHYIQETLASTSDLKEKLLAVRREIEETHGKIGCLTLHYTPLTVGGSGNGFWIMPRNRRNEKSRGRWLETLTF